MRLFFKIIFREYQQMQFDKIDKYLKEVDNSFNPSITIEVEKFLKQYIGTIASEQPCYHIVAAAAIVCECTKVQAIDMREEVGNGIKIENIMKRLKHLSKEKLLEIMDVQVQKYPEAPDHLKEKIKKVRIAYRMFKKYKNIFEELSKRVKVVKNIATNLLSFFWIVYLLIKAKIKAVDDIEESTKILIIMIQAIFSTHIAQIDLSIINEIISQKQNFTLTFSISHEQTNTYQNLLLQEIQAAYKKRKSCCEGLINSLMTDEILLPILVDDLSSLYEKIFTELPEGTYIDEITFLGLQKNLTPYPDHKRQQGELICKVINFFSQDEEETITQKKIQDQHSDKNLNHEFASMTSLRINYMTPLTVELAKASWVKNCLKTIKQFAYQKITDLLEHYGKSQTMVRNKINKGIQKLKSRPLREDKKDQIFKLFIFIAWQLCKKNMDFRVEHFFDEILCLTVCIYNFAIYSSSIEFKNYRQVFGIDILKGFEIINHVSSLKVDRLIEQYLFQIEKSILIKELWQTELGHKLMIEDQLKGQYLLGRRLHKHIQQRIKEICSKINIQSILQEKIKMLVIVILQNKSQMLFHNKLDQIIICSITACLSSNESKNSKAISEIFHHYNESSYSFQSLEYGLHFREQKMNLIKFYNQVFLIQVQNIMKHKEEPFSFSPIREKNLKKTKSIIPLSSPFSSPTQQNEIIYQKNLRNNRHLKKEEEMIPEEVESPKCRKRDHR